MTSLPTQGEGDDRLASACITARRRRCCIAVARAISYRPGASVDAATDTALAHLRRKLGDIGPAPARIKTIRRAGHLFAPAR